MKEVTDTAFNEVTLVAQVQSGACIGCVISEAVVIALSENRKITFKFNEQAYIINPTKLLNNIASNPKAYE